LYKGDERILLADLLTKPKNSIVCQSHRVQAVLPFIPNYQQTQSSERNQLINGDGFGVAWYGEESNHPCVFTSIKPSWNDKNLVRLAEHVWSKLVFSHVRAASPGSLIVENNCHPFQYGKLLFMHNGAIANFDKVKKKLIAELSDETFRYIQGTTDTEHAGALFVQNLPNSDPNFSHSEEVLIKVVKDTIKQILKFTKAVCNKASSLNFALTNGEITIATRFRNSDSEDPPSLYYTTCSKYSCKQGKTILEHESQYARSVVVSSEPLTEDTSEWALVPKNSILLITKDNKVIIEEITIESELMIFGSPKVVTKVISRGSSNNGMENPCGEVTSPSLRKSFDKLHYNNPMRVLERSPSGTSQQVGKSMEMNGNNSSTIKTSPLTVGSVGLKDQPIIPSVNQLCNIGTSESQGKCCAKMSIVSSPNQKDQEFRVEIVFGKKECFMFSMMTSILMLVMFILITFVMKEKLHLTL